MLRARPSRGGRRLARSLPESRVEERRKGERRREGWRRTGDDLQQVARFAAEDAGAVDLADEVDRVSVEIPAHICVSI